VTGLPVPPSVHATPYSEIVILLPGLGRTSRMFRPLRARLRRAGYTVYALDYPGTRFDAWTLASMVRAGIERLVPRDRRAHFVGHSLGAILARGALVEPTPFQLGRVVMVAPPNRGAGVLNRMAAAGPILKPVFGPVLGDLAVGSDYLRTLGRPDTEIGVIAGTERFHACNPSAYHNWWAGTVRPHDGTVEVENTRLDGMTDFITVPANHTTICRHPAAIRQTLHFLAHGRFDHDVAASALKRNQ